MSNSNIAAEGVSADAVAAEIVANILRAAHRLRALLTSHYGEFGLSDVRHGVLQVVRDAGSQGCSQTELAEHLEQSESSISTLVDRMRASGLLYRLRSKSDRRKRVLMLTDTAREVLLRIDTCHAARTAVLLSGFDQAELVQLQRMLERLVSDLCRLRVPSEPAAPMAGESGVLEPGPVVPAETRTPAA